MQEFNRKKKIKRFLYSKLSIVLLFFVFASVAKASFEVYRKERESGLNKIQAEKQLEVLRERQKNLSSDIERLQNSNGIEEEIRKKYKLGKEGESMIVIVDNEEDKAQAASAEAATNGMFQKIKHFFHLGKSK